MKKIRLGINGFGRIGRVATRIAANRKNIEIAAINSRAEIRSHAYLLKHDSTYGTFEKSVEIKEGKIWLGGKPVLIFQESDPKNIPWSSAKVDIVVESSGVFRDFQSAGAHLGETVKMVVISAPPKDNIPTYCMGVNQDKFNSRKDKIISNASCTTNCLATVAKVLEDNFGIVNGFMTTIHSYTDSQNLLDNSHKKDLRLSRSAPQNMIPSSSGASYALSAVIPQLKDKIISSSLRVPTASVSLIDLIVTVKKKTTAEEVNKAFLQASSSYLKNILQLSFSELVSSDIKGNPASSVVDGMLTRVNDNMVNVKAWYDNEWGYATRLVDLIEFAADKMI